MPETGTSSEWPLGGNKKRPRRWVERQRILVHLGSLNIPPLEWQEEHPLSH